MSTDQPAQGSTAEYCSRWPGEPHRLILSVKADALVSVSRCSLCGWIDFDDLREQALALIADGRRQATEGWEREWKVIDEAGEWPAQERDLVWRVGEGDRVVSRLVGPWEPASESALPTVEHARGCACGINDAGQRVTDLICRRPS